MESWTGPDGTRIAYRTAGTGPLTVLSHGGFIDGSSFTALVEELAATRTVVAPDRRGHGASSPYAGPHRFEDDVDDLVGLTQALRGDRDDVELLGVSAGSHVALGAAGRVPVSRVVVWEPPDFQARRVTPELWQRLHRAVERGDRKRIARTMLNDVVGPNVDMHVPWFVFPALYRSGFGRTLLANALAAPTELAAFEDHLWTDEELARLRLPVHLLVGSGSPPFMRRFPDLVLQHVPTARLRLVDDAGHGFPMDDAARFARVLEDVRRDESA